MVGDNRCGVSLEQSLPGRRNKRLMNTTIPVVVINFGKCECAVAMWARLKRKHLHIISFCDYSFGRFVHSMSLIDPPRTQSPMCHFSIVGHREHGTKTSVKEPLGLSNLHQFVNRERAKDKKQLSGIGQSSIECSIACQVMSGNIIHKKLHKLKKNADSCKCCILSGYQDVDIENIRTSIDCL